MLACRTPAGTTDVSAGRDLLRPLGLVAERLPPWFYERGSLRRAPALHALRRLSAAGRLGANVAPRALRDWREERTEVAVVGANGNVGGVVVGVYEGKVLGVVRQDALVALAFDRLVLDTVAYDMPPPVEGNDLPGVIGLAAFEAYALQGGLRSGTRAAVWGPPERVARALEVASANDVLVTWMGERAPSRIEGRHRVRAVDDTPCELFVSAVGQPALELAAQAGARLALAGTGLPVVVTEEVPAWLELRGDATASESGVPPAMIPDSAFACLCEDVRARDIRASIAGGFDHPELVKRRTGAMTGPCQGKLCTATVLSLLREAGKEHRPTTSRPPARALTLADLAVRA